MGKKKLKWRKGKLQRGPCLKCRGKGAFDTGNGRIATCPRCDGSGKEPGDGHEN